jgi:hypothetical protein
MRERKKEREREKYKTEIKTGKDKIDRDIK